MFMFFQCWFLERHPWIRTALLNLWVPALIWQRFTFDFKRAFAGCSWSMADSQVQMAIVSLVALKKRKRLPQFRDETRPSLAPLLHALKRRQYALLQAILGCLNPPRLWEVLDASIFLKYFDCFFAVPFPLFLPFSFSILYFCVSFFILLMTLTVISWPLDSSCTWYTERF